MDAIELTIFKNIFQSISDEMGKILQYASFSPNIKERRDFSCALFTPNGESFAFGSHIPVHLGAMPLSVKSVLSEIHFEKGDMVITNDPYKGGSHLPDITMIAPVFRNDKIVFYVANRAHHSDVGGMRAGSMPLSSEIFQEGLIIPPLRILKRDKPDQDIIDLILSNVRTPEERKGDLLAQIAANKRGIQRLEEMISRYGLETIEHNARELIDYTERLLRSFIRDIPDGEYVFEDVMDDDGFNTRNIGIKISVTVQDDRLVIDFNGSSPQVTGGINANEAVTYSCVLYVLTSLLNEEVPINSGIMRPVKLELPKNSIINAAKPCGLAGGNVETSQRITDVLLGAFSKVLRDTIPAASQGTMNNISFGSHGFAYYETIGGGSGAGPTFHGASGVHTNMTNSLNTSVEALELCFPIEIENYLIRDNSGGKGLYNGGDGLVRTYKFLDKMHVSILSDRRCTQPYGLEGGEAGKSGENMLLLNLENVVHGWNREIKLESKVNVEVNNGDVLIIKTPGGGGYGIPS